MLCSICYVMNYYTLPIVHSTLDTVVIRTESKRDLDMWIEWDGDEIGFLYL